MNRTIRLLQFVRTTCAAVCIVAQGACDPSGSAHGSTEIVRDTLDGLERVRNLGSGVWSEGATIREDLLIGVHTGPDELMFGDVVALTVASDGSLFVFDRQVPALRRFSATGQFMRTVGAKGSGPGEHLDAVTGLAIRSDGSLLAHDVRNQRIIVYDGNSLEPIAHWPVTSSLFVDRSITTDSLGRAFVSVISRRQLPGDAGWPIGLLRLRPDGTPIDTLQPPTLSREPTIDAGPLAAQKILTQTPYVTVVGISDKYEFQIHDRTGSAVRRVSRSAAPISVRDDERRAYEALREWEIKDESPEVLPPPTPTTKPFYKEFLIANDGRIWVRKFMPAVAGTQSKHTATDGRPAIPFEEPTGFDVFSQDGTYLAELVFPIGFHALWIGSDSVYGVRYGEQGEQIVVRYRFSRRQGSS